MERQVILDTETTGLKTEEGHGIIEIGCLEMMNRRLTGRKFHTYLNPGRPIDPGAMAISGITNEFVQDKPKFHEIVEEFIAFIEGAELIIHNASFDVGFINAELLRIKHSRAPIDPYVKIFDTLILARKLHPGQKNNLDALCKRYKIDNSHRTYHGALLDAEILAKVYLQMTSGQATLSLEDDKILEQKTSTKIRKIKIRRQTSSLAVIRASEEELKLHQQIMESLNH